MAIQGVSIVPKYSYSMSGSNLVLTPDTSYVTYKVTVTVNDASERNTSGHLDISGIAAGLTCVEGNKIKLIANDMAPWADVRFKVAAASATKIDFKVTPTLDDGQTFAATQPPRAPINITWLGAGVLYPTLATASQPDDIPALDTNDPTANAKVTVKVTDSSQAPIANLSLLIGPSGQQDITRYQYLDVNTSAPLTFGSNTIPSTGSPALLVTTDASGQAGFTMSIPPGDDSLAALAQFISWGVQLQGGEDATYFPSTDAIFIGPLTSEDAPTVPMPFIYDAQGSLQFDPKGNNECTLQMTAEWDNPSNSDNILVIVGDDDSPPRPRQLLTVGQCNYGGDQPGPNSTLMYLLDVNRLIEGYCPLRFLVFKTGLSDVAYSHANLYTITKLPPVKPLGNVNRVLPIPRLFCKAVGNNAQPVLGDELKQGAKINWNDINRGGIYVYIPYAATNGSTGMNGAANVKIYRNGIYQGGADVVSLPKLYPPVQVGDNVVSPDGTAYGLGHGLLMLIPIDDLRNWNAPTDGMPRPFEVEYWDDSKSRNYSVVWSGVIDTVPVKK
ncbi:hypothetical protein C9I57_27705 [Trinickia symbiotica]|uniref:Uncharacterized protein n=1 Tax=Trinickia symbiotica TaxID=863227 RepID=A0A2T3XM16_9BURK|nr:hypothetical protein [Trinickia symbiotica]PTB17477.1 hypothetical protein C9I57_27705 [Trinickia symbiotica]